MHFDSTRAGLFIASWSYVDDLSRSYHGGHYGRGRKSQPYSLVCHLPLDDTFLNIKKEYSTVFDLFRMPSTFETLIEE